MPHVSAVARRVEPGRRHALGVAARVGLLGRQARDPARPDRVREIEFRGGRGARHVLAQEPVALLGRRREARQIEEEPPDEDLGLRFGARGDALALELREDEAVDGVRGPGRVVDGGEGGSFRRDEGPVRLVPRAVLDPAPDDRGLVLRQRAPAALRGGMRTSSSRSRCGGRALSAAVGDDRRVAVADRRRALLDVEAQVGCRLPASGPWRKQRSRGSRGCLCRSAEAPTTRDPNRRKRAVRSRTRGRTCRGSAWEGRFQGGEPEAGHCSE
jgi:hypothetical protein